MSATTVILEGSMGKALGREWKFQNIRSARQALAMIDANTGKAFAWVRDNLQKYAKYRVLVEYEDGRKDSLDAQTYTDMSQRKVKAMRFVPLIEGASAVGRVVLGAVILVAGFATGQVWAMSIGAAIALGGVAELLSPKPKSSSASNSEDGDKNSHYFNGASNMSNQGTPVQLVYGRCKVGSQAISAAMTVDQIL